MSMSLAYVATNAQANISDLYAAWYHVDVQAHCPELAQFLSGYGRHSGELTLPFPAA